MQRITDLSIVEHELCVKLFSICGSTYIRLSWPVTVCHEIYGNYPNSHQLVSITEVRNYVNFCKDYKNLKEPNRFSNNCSTRCNNYLIFYAFIADFDEDKRLFKLKNNLKTETDVYELFLNPTEYIKKHYTHEEIYSGYMPGYNIDVYALESILGSSFAARVFNSKQLNPPVLLTGEQTEKDQIGFRTCKTTVQPKKDLTKTEEDSVKDRSKEKEIAKLKLRIQLLEQELDS